MCYGAHLPHPGTSQEGREASGLNSYKTGDLSQCCVGLPAGVAAGEKWAWPVSQLWPFPHPCVSLDVRVCSCVPPHPALGGSNPGQALKVPLPASMGDLAAIRSPALGGLPSAQREHRAYLWLNETDNWRPHGCLEAGQAPAPRKVHIRPRAQLALAWALCPLRLVWEEVV